MRAPGTESGRARLDTGIAHPARVYDYWLGGKDNFAADWAAAEGVIAARPTVVRYIRANTAFMHRAVAYLAAQAGIRQFLDIGSGIPTSPNLHEVAPGIAPEARVVYVDNEPIVLSHARALFVRPGLAQCHRWHPEPEADAGDYEVSAWAAAARNPSQSDRQP